MSHSSINLSKAPVVRNVVPKLYVAPAVGELLPVVKTTVAEKCAFLTSVLVK